MLNGTPMGPGWFLLFNNLDVAPAILGFDGIKEPDSDKEVLDLITIVFSFLERE